MNGSIQSPSHVESFLEMLAAERGAAENTLASYRRDMVHFSEFCKNSIDVASPDDIRRYLVALADQGLSDATAARRLSARRIRFEPAAIPAERDQTLDLAPSLS